MTIDTDALADYYAGLLIIQYFKKQKAIEHVKVDTKAYFLDDLYSQIRDAFDIDTAIGVQLDTLAKYVGTQREIVGEAGTFLTDDDLRTIINLKIIQNNSNHSDEQIDQLIFDFFGATVVVADNFNMTMTYILPDTIPDLITQVVNSKALPKPAGVGILLIVVPDPTNIFGFHNYMGTNPPYINGFRTYVGTNGATWVTY